MEHLADARRGDTSTLHRSMRKAAGEHFTMVLVATVNGTFLSDSSPSQADPAYYDAATRRAEWKFSAAQPHAPAPKMCRLAERGALRVRRARGRGGRTVLRP